AKPATAPMLSKYWKLPLNWRELLEETRWAAGGDFALDVKAPDTVTAELLSQKSTGTLFVHLLNYDAARRPAVSDLEVSLQIPPGKKVAEVRELSPDHAAAALRFTVQKGRAQIHLPKLETYSIVVVRTS
ncbi:MAG TPA: hypothetical protein VEU62_18175, partial [Bryobacterales bacterium]|nr:hypothetical protein [Bryobacterales bacterium]